MSGIQTSIMIQDRMTPVLQSITNSMGLMLASFSDMQIATGTAFDSTSMAAVQQEIANAAAELILYNEELNKAQKEPVKTPDPVWNSALSAPVFLNTGADRFAAELQSANSMAQQLCTSQQNISAQARQMDITPPGMVNDMEAVERRMQALAGRIQKLNSIPVNLQTERTNNEIEMLRGKLSQAVTIQGELNQSMTRMDISAANSAYQRLNGIMNDTERDLRDNLSAQERFNQSMNRGTAAAGGLEDSIRRWGAMILSAATAGKVIAVADEFTQTSARLNLLNEKYNETGDIQQRIYESAKRSSSPYMETASAIAKLGLNAGSAFRDTNELVSFMEQVNKQFVIGGASAQEQSGAMVQLTQAMASGALRGEELNSILDAAPGIARAIEQSMGWAEGSIKKYAEKGAVSASVVKNALFDMAEETNRKFNDMPKTFSQVWTDIQSDALMAFQPVLQQLSAVTQTSDFATLVNGITSSVQTLASGAVQALNMMGQAAVWVKANWEWLAPVIGGVAAAVVAYKIAMIGYNVVTAISTAVMNGFSGSLLACPLTWIVLAIIAVVVAIAIWINHVGGIKVAWLIVVNAVMTKVDQLKLCFVGLVMLVQNQVDNMVYKFEAFKVGVLNALGMLKVMGLTILENFINGAIDRINRLINLANNIPGIAIKPIEHVEFAAGAAVEEEAARQQRNSDLQALSDQNAQNKAERRQAFSDMIAEAEQRKLDRENDIAAARAEAANNTNEQAEDENNSSAQSTAENTAATAGNTAKIADKMDLLDDDLKYMRQIAEQEIINRYTTAEVKVEQTNYNSIASSLDLDGIVNGLTSSIGEAANMVVEGAHP